VVDREKKFKLLGIVQASRHLISPGGRESREEPVIC
jgi:hypothetical protein